METRKEHTYQPIVSEREYYDLEHRSEIREGARKLRRQYLRYKEAEIIYSMSHKKLQRSSTACPTRNCWSLPEKRVQSSGWMEQS